MSYQKMDVSRNDSLFSVEISSIAQGYKVLNELTSTKDLRVIEASPLGAKLLILTLGPTPVLEKARETLHKLKSSQEFLFDHELLSEIAPEVIDAIYSLSQVELDESLLILECKTISGLLSAANEAVTKHSLKAIELKILRSSEGGGYGFFTGKRSDVASAAVESRGHFAMNPRQGRAEVVESPTEAFRSFFNLSGQ